MLSCALDKIRAISCLRFISCLLAMVSAFIYSNSEKLLNAWRSRTESQQEVQSLELQDHSAHSCVSIS